MIWHDAVCSGFSACSRVSELIEPLAIASHDSAGVAHAHLQALQLLVEGDRQQQTHRTHIVCRHKHKHKQQQHGVCDVMRATHVSPHTRKLLKKATTNLPSQLLPTDPMGHELPWCNRHSRYASITVLAIVTASRRHCLVDL
jgi:hypothetical protein